MAFNDDNSVFPPSGQQVQGSFAGRYAVSLAGHDKGRLYVVVGEEPGKPGGAVHLLLADGHTRGFSCPKRKKLRHVQVLKACDNDIAAAIKSASPVDDSVLIHSLKCFRASGACRFTGQNEIQ